MDTETRPHIARQVVSFGMVAAVGLVIDFAGFALLTGVGVVPWLANVLSAATSVTAVYFLATRYTFGADAKLGSYLLFFGWYAMMIVLVSVAIQLLVNAYGGWPLGWKLATIPVSFTANFLFSRYLFRR